MMLKRRAGSTALAATFLLALGSAACQSGTETNSTATPSWPHEPSGLNGIATKANDRDYNWVTADVSGTQPTASGWFNPYPGDFTTTGQLSLITDASAPFPASVVQVKYPIGWNQGSAPGEVDLEHQPVTEYYLGFYVKISKPYLAVGGGHNKLAYIYSGTKDLVFEFTPQSNTANGTVYSGPWNFFFAEYVSHNGAEFDTYGSVPLQSGVWYKVEILMSYSQSVIKWWVNDALDGTIPCDFNANAGGPLHLLQFSPTYGGGGQPTKTEVDYIWYNHVHMSGKP